MKQKCSTVETTYTTNPRSMMQVSSLYILLLLVTSFFSFLVPGVSTFSVRLIRTRPAEFNSYSRVKTWLKRIRTIICVLVSLFNFWFYVYFNCRIDTMLHFGLCERKRRRWRKKAAWYYSFSNPPLDYKRQNLIFFFIFIVLDFFSLVSVCYIKLLIDSSMCTSVIIQLSGFCQ